MRALSLLGTICANNSGGARRPRMLTHTVTFKCNARCIMCDSWKIRSKADLELEEIEGIYAQLPELDVVRLTGGEPFVRADFPEIVEAAQRLLNPLQMHVTTNGFSTDAILDFAERRSRTRPLDLLISLDGVGETHNRIRGRDTAWETAFETLKQLSKSKRRLALRLRVNQTIVDPEGLEAYRELRAALAPLGLRQQVVVAYDESAMYSTERGVDVVPDDDEAYATYGKFSEAQLEQLLETIDADLAELPCMDRQAKRYYLRGLRARLLGVGQRLSPACVALHSHLRLLPNGDVPTCQFSSKVVGNLRTSTFAEIWSSPRAEERRKWVRACKGCWAECEVLPSAIYTGDLLFHHLRKPGKKPERAAGAPAIQS